MSILIQAIISLIKNLRLFQVVMADQKAVKLRYGKIKKVLKPGAHFKIPFVDQIESRVVVEQVLDSRIQSLTTKDLQTVGVGIKVSYEIDDVESALFSVYNVEDAIEAESSVVLSDAIMDRKFDELMDHDQVEVDLYHELSNKCKNWGVVIRSISINDCVKLKAFRLIQDSDAYSESASLE